MGRIGRALARRCSRGFDMRVLAYDPMPDPAYAKANGIELTDLETLLRTSDFVSIHIPHTKENEGFMNAERFALMKPSAYFINTARGVLVDEEALYDALKNKRIAGAGLDVFRKEPPVGSPLLIARQCGLPPALVRHGRQRRARDGHQVHRLDPCLLAEASTRAPNTCSIPRSCPLP